MVITGPDPRMGSEAGFSALIREAMAMGFHMMPMFGINVVNTGMENVEVWAVPGRVKRVGTEITRVRLRPEHPRAWDVYRALPLLLAPGQTLAFLG